MTNLFETEWLVQSHAFGPGVTTIGQNVELGDARQDESELVLTLHKAGQDDYPVSAASAVRAIDNVLRAAFVFADEPFDLDRDLIDVAPCVDWRDKWPQPISGTPSRTQGGHWAKQSFGRDWNRTANACLTPAGEATWARFNGKGREHVSLPCRYSAAIFPWQGCRAGPRNLFGKS